MQGRPDELRLIGVLCMEMRPGFDRLGNEPLVILAANLFGVIRETDIQMGLEDQMHALF